MAAARRDAAGGRLAGSDAPEVRLLWRALVPTAGVALGLALIVAVEHPDWGARLQAVIVAVVALNQLVGPIIFRAALAQAREIGGTASGLVVVSNREPWVHEYAPDGSIVARPTPGGVSVALDALMRERGGVWIAHGAGSADRDVVDERGSDRGAARRAGLPAAAALADADAGRALLHRLLQQRAVAALPSGAREAGVPGGGLGSLSGGQSPVRRRGRD